MDIVICPMWIKEISVKKHITIVGLILLVLLYGCGGASKQLRKDEKKQLKNYKEWIKAIDVFENDEYVIGGFLDDSEVRVQMNQLHSSDEEFMKILDADNEFVDKNPDYFETGKTRVIEVLQDNEKGYDFAFGNTTSMGYFEVPDSYNIQVSDNKKLTVTCIYTGGITNESGIISLANDNTEVLMFDYSNRRVMNQQSFDTSCIGLFPNLKYLVINVDTTEYENYDGTDPTIVDDYSELVDKIKAEYKDIDIYVLCEGKRLN